VKGSLTRLLAPLQRRIWALVARAVVRTVDEGGARQTLQLELLTGEVRDRVERFQQFGFYGRPPAGAEAVALFISGDRAQGIVVAVEHRDERPMDLADGEVCVRAAGGTEIRVRADGTVLVRAGAGVRVEAAQLEVTGDIVAGGNVRDGAGTLAAVRDTYNLHTHPETGAVTGPPTPPVLG
jgi:phage baseplate assembly protein V